MPEQGLTRHRQLSPPRSLEANYVGLPDELVEEIVDRVYEISEKAANGVSGRRFVKPKVVSDETVLPFSGNRACTVDVLVVALWKAAKDTWLLMNSCPSLLQGVEPAILQQKHEYKMFEQQHYLGSRHIQQAVYRWYLLEGIGTSVHSISALIPPMGGFL